MSLKLFSNRPCIPNMPPEQDVELESLSDRSDVSEASDLSDQPDSPLVAPVVTQRQWPRPRWLAPVKPSTLRASTALVARRPVASLLLLVAAAYVLSCVLRRVPLLASPLPPYTGPHAVGSVDVEVPLPTPRLISHTTFDATGKPAFELESVLFTFYYPVDAAVGPSLPARPWMPKPISLTAEGYAKFAHANIFLIRQLFTLALWLIVGGITVPSRVDAPLLSSPEPLPVVVFSHGMASSRTDYTAYLGELASRGHVVAAVEHRDGSCPGTLVIVPGKQDRRLLHFSATELRSVPPMDAQRLKAEQLAFREAEVFEVVRLLDTINAGNASDVAASNSRPEGRTLHAWTSRLDLTRLTLGGHSYGATLALQALARAPFPVAGGIVLDPGKSSGPLNPNASVPILVVHSDSWSRQPSLFFGRPHFDVVRRLVRGILNRTGAAWFVTALGTSHPSVSDAPLIEPLLLRWATGASMDAREALKGYVAVSVDFLRFLRTGKPEGLLAEPVTHDTYASWVSEERMQSFQLARLWKIHVSSA
ncbi:hypothetical protein DCS_00037 [Drechmeria coniospora]|uniref:Putative phospholipase n=1 Tax=Drechmeria coniospora TaxID=98403 RepID=A0A151GP96_DRECN|nr:hypothetical protein DCS_00037 [Drechmeria coniospora]KYK58910.1 hypothetical protein DCS_00037 [Drechmeria coniospora]